MRIKFEHIDVKRETYASHWRCIQGSGHNTVDFFVWIDKDVHSHFGSSNAAAFRLETCSDRRPAGCLARAFLPQAAALW